MDAFKKMTLKELATRLHVKELTVRLWVRQGKIKTAAGRGRGLYMVTEAEFERFKEEYKPQPEAIGTPYYKRYAYETW